MQVENVMVKLKNLLKTAANHLFISVLSKKRNNQLLKMLKKCGTRLVTCMAWRFHTEIDRNSTTSDDLGDDNFTSPHNVSSAIRARRYRHNGHSVQCYVCIDPSHGDRTTLIDMAARSGESSSQV
jgi:hypothetical protein